jgi:hypothetical protein
MMKYLFLVSAMTMAVPGLAQQMPIAPQQATPATATPANPDTVAPPASSSQSAVPAQSDSSGTPVPMTAQSSTPGQTAPVQTTQTPSVPQPGVSQPAPQSAQATPAQQPATSGNQVAQVVNSEFPTYDKDGNGQLSQAEFSSWMVALKQASDPSAKAGDPATTKWVSAAFTQADTDKSRSVSKSELTSFLSQGASASAGGR